MSLARANAIASVTVGTSDEYPVQALRHSVEPVGDDGGNDVVYDRVRLSLDCFAEAASRATVATLMATVQSQLNTRGLSVTLTQFGEDAVTMLAGGAAGGPRLGFPVCSVSNRPAQSVGTHYAFTLNIVAEIPRAGTSQAGYDVVRHTTTTEIADDGAGGVTTVVRGEVEVANGQNAQTFIQDEVLDPTHTAAAAVPLKFVSKISRGRDLAKASYEWTTSPPTVVEVDFGGNSLFAEVTDATQDAPGGRTVRTITGRANGPHATAFAEAQEPAGPNEPVTKRVISAPATPSGVVTFSYESLITTGSVSGFGSARLISYQQDIDVTPGAEQIEATAFAGAAPTLHRSFRNPWVYTQVDTVEFIGTFADAIAGVTPMFNADDRSGDPALRMQNVSGIRKLVISQRFVFDSEQTLPIPRELL